MSVLSHQTAGAAGGASSRSNGSAAPLLRLILSFVRGNEDSCSGAFGRLKKNAKARRMLAAEFGTTGESLEFAVAGLHFS